MIFSIFLIEKQIYCILSDILLHLILDGKFCIDH